MFDKMKQGNVHVNVTVRFHLPAEAVSIGLAPLALPLLVLPSTIGLTACCSMGDEAEPAPGGWASVDGCDGWLSGVADG